MSGTSIESFLEQVGEVSIPSISFFSVKEILNEANIKTRAGNFDSIFMEYSEREIEGRKLVIYRLKRFFSGKTVLEQLGEQGVIKLAHFLELVRMQANGEKGFLATDGNSNYALVRDQEGNVQSVSLFWNPMGHYWAIATFPLNYGYKWLEDEYFVCYGF